MGVGRYAPSPSGDLHLGNLRTAVLAHLCAATSGRDIVLRIDDLDRVREGAAERQLEDLAALGLRWGQPVVYQSTRLARYEQVIDGLIAQGRTFECFCTRRDIAQAASAPHRPPGAYRGTCRELGTAERDARRELRAPAIRFRSEVTTWTFADRLHGDCAGEVDDFVLRRADHIPAYNLTVVVDDADAGVDQVVRGDDLLASTPRQAYLANLLGYKAPEYIHVPLVLNTSGERLAKRDGAVTLRELTARGVDVLQLIGTSLGLPSESLGTMLEEFNLDRIPREAYIFDPSVY